MWCIPTTATVPMNKGEIISTETEQPGYSIDFRPATLKQENELTAAIVETKWAVLSSSSMGPLSPGAITIITPSSSQDDSAMTTDEEEDDNFTFPNGELEIAKIQGIREETSEDWNLVVASSSNGEPSVVSISAHDSIAASSCAQGEELLTLHTPTEGLQQVDEGVEKDQVSMADFEELRRLEQEDAVKESGEGIIEPMKILRKGVVAALGGTLVAVGLVMIPLPTPCGVLVASSGMAVLGNEFDGARVMNEKITNAAKKHWGEAREKMIQGIEEMEGKRPTTIGGTEEDDSKLKTERQRAESVQVLSSTNNTPLPIMNPEEQAQQEELAKLRSSKAKKQPDFFDHLKRATGAYLSRHILPHLKRSKEESEASSVPDADISLQSETETISEIDQDEELEKEPVLADAMVLDNPAERIEPN